MEKKMNFKEGATFIDESDGVKTYIKTEPIGSTDQQSQDSDEITITLKLSPEQGGELVVKDFRVINPGQENPIESFIYSHGPRKGEEIFQQSDEWGTIRVPGMAYMLFINGGNKIFWNIYHKAQEM